MLAILRRTSFLTPIYGLYFSHHHTHMPSTIRTHQKLPKHQRNEKNCSNWKRYVKLLMLLLKLYFSLKTIPLDGWACLFIEKPSYYCWGLHTNKLTTFKPSLLYISTSVWVLHTSSAGQNHINEVTFTFILRIGSESLCQMACFLNCSIVSDVFYAHIRDEWLELDLELSNRNIQNQLSFQITKYQTNPLLTNLLNERR